MRGPGRGQVGARSFAAIADGAGELTGPDLARLGLTRPVAPQESTLRRVQSGVDASVLDGLVGAFPWTRTRAVEGRRVIAVDGRPPAAPAPRPAPPQVRHRT